MTGSVDDPEMKAMRRMADARCVFCRKQPIDPAWRPFCSERCKLQDLARWVDGDYRVEGTRDDADGGKSEVGSPKSEDPDF